MRLGQDRGACHRPVVLAIDGRSSSGKTTLAARLRNVIERSAVVHTDDIAWWHSRFGWADLLVDGILIPAHAGQPVTYRPPRWDERQREGAIEVPADCSLLIIEGVGAARHESTHLTDAAVWVQSDERETERRTLARVGKPGESPAVQHVRDWMAEEMPFLADQRPWERADLIACGTPETPFDPATELVIASPPAGNNHDHRAISVISRVRSGMSRLLTGGPAYQISATRTAEYAALQAGGRGSESPSSTRETSEPRSSVRRSCRRA
jgi:hypothetical protein